MLNPNPETEFRKKNYCSHNIDFTVLTCVQFFYPNKNKRTSAIMCT